MNFLLIFIFMLLSLSFYMIFERKMLSVSQMRVGPMKTLYYGFFQFLSDGLKIFFIDLIDLYLINYYLFYFIPVLNFFLSLLMWYLMMYKNMILSLMYGMMIFLMFLMVKMLLFMILSWIINCNYSLLSLIRIVTQMMSYDILMLIYFLFFFFFFFYMNFFNFNMFMMPIILFSLLFFIIWVIVMLSEFGRLPFDFYEGESELVSGFNIEYSSMFILLIFIFEYLDLIMFSFMTVYMYINLMFFFFVELLMFLFIIVRGFIIRFRYDKMMMMMWKTLVYICFNYLFLVFMMVLNF